MSAGQSSKYKFTEEVDRLADLVGADRAADIIKTRLESQSGPLDVSGDTVPVDPTGIVADAAFERKFNLKADSELTYHLEGLGADRLLGRVKRLGTAYTVTVTWENDEGQDLFTETVASNVAAGTVTDIDLAPVSPNCTVTVSDAGSGEGLVTAALHLR